MCRSSCRCGYRNGSGEEGDNYVVLSDILGDEDHLGDGLQTCRFRDGISALQMDIKIEGITKEIMQVALNQAKGARLHILGVMEQAINAPRGDISQFGICYRYHQDQPGQDQRCYR
ncbi:hypothetical protein ACLB1M_25285 [Escherichia coli]